MAYEYALNQVVYHRQFSLTQAFQDGCPPTSLLSRADGQHNIKAQFGDADLDIAQQAGELDNDPERVLDNTRHSSSLYLSIR